MEAEPPLSPNCRVEAVREVRIETDSRKLEASARFYTDVLGLSRWPGNLAPPGCVGLGPLRRGVLLEPRHDPEVDPNKRRLTVALSSLVEFAKYLEFKEIPFERGMGFWASDNRIVVCDPTGHRIEVRESSAV